MVYKNINNPFFYNVKSYCFVFIYLKKLKPNEQEGGKKKLLS